MSIRVDIKCFQNDKLDILGALKSIGRKRFFLSFISADKRMLNIEDLILVFEAIMPI